MIMRFIRVSTQFEAVHQYPGAPDEVSYLRNPHRHMFHVNCTIQVFHDDRELEFIVVKHQLDKAIAAHKWEPCTSCEMMAEWIAKQILLWYQDRDGSRVRTVEVTVSEDGENGATVAIS